MRLSSLIAAGVLAISSFVSFAQAQVTIDPRAIHEQNRRAHHNRAAQAPGIAHQPRYVAPRHAAPHAGFHQPRAFHNAPRAMPFPVIVPQTHYVDRPVYIQQQPQYYAPQPRYYAEEPTYRPRRAAQRCRTVVARDRWGARHYVKKCRPVGRRYR